MIWQEPGALLTSLRGQEVTLCDLNAIFSGWPSEVNPNLDRLRQDVEVWLEKCDCPVREENVCCPADCDVS
jgi:hypothetical protein